MTKENQNEKVIARQKEMIVEYTALKVEAQLRNDELLTILYGNIIENCKKVIKALSRSELAMLINQRIKEIKQDDAPVIDIECEILNTRIADYGC